MNRLSSGECLPVPNNEAGRVIQLRDPSSNSVLSEPQDIRQCPHKLIIPASSICTPNSPSSCVQSACESVAPYLVLMPSPEPQVRNVVVFGESGVGKSSVINMIAGEDITRTSNDAVGCTFQYQCHQVPIDGFTVNLWDTVGLDEGTEGTVPARQAEVSFKSFLHEITRFNGVDLLLYCVRGTRVRQALLRNYNLFYAAICRKKVPIALVVTGLENYMGDMEAWWVEHEKDLIKHGMRFDAHACVTTIRSDHPAIQDRLNQSRTVLRNLVRANSDAITWRADEDSLVSASLPDVRALLRAAEKRVTPLIMTCDDTEQGNGAHLFPVAKILPTCIGNQNYKYLHVDTVQISDWRSRRRGEMTQRPDLLIFYADAQSEPDRIWTALEQFHISFSGKTCPLIIIFGGLESHGAAAKMWGILSSSHSGEIIASPAYYPGSGCPRETVERADEALIALIEEKCLIKFEEKLTKLQKFCRHGKVFLRGRI